MAFFIQVVFVTLTITTASASIRPDHTPTEGGYVVLREDRSLAWQPAAASRRGGDGDAVPASAIVEATYEDTIPTTGVGRLSVHTVASVSAVSNDGSANTDNDLLLFKAMGYAEGFLTAHRVVQQLFNTLDSLDAAPPLDEFLTSHQEYMHTSVARHSSHDAYWRTVGLLLEREKGIAEGVRTRLQTRSPTILEATTADAQPVEFAAQVASLSDRILQRPNSELSKALLRLTLVSDLEEVGRAINYRGNLTAKAASTDLMAGLKGHCSALIKTVGPRLLIGHATWSNFNEMLRIWKDVSFAHAEEPMLANRRISFSSYPGYSASTDDWLTLPDQQMQVLETTLDCHDDARLARHVTPEVVNTPLRSMVSSLLASSPREWAQTFSRESSGTQNNQWMILSLEGWRAVAEDGQNTVLRGASRWGSGKSAHDVFWVLEQQPGLIVARDKTQALLNEGYWASYNVPHYDEILSASLYMDRRSSVCKCEGQRGPILDAAQRSVDSVESLQDLLTTNNWHSNELSWSCPKCAVAARFDIAGKNDSIGAEFPADTGMQKCGASGLFGAIDAKVSDDIQLGRGESLFVSGPASHGIRPFDWAEAKPAGANTRHAGHPEGPWEFPWQRFGNKMDGGASINSQYTAAGARRTAIDVGTFEEKLVQLFE